MKGDQKPHPLIATPASERDADFSPDGKWLAYISDESGKDELFVVPFPGPGGKRQISSTGASSFHWLGDGSQIAYLTPERKLIGVDVDRKGATFEIGASHPLFGGLPLPVTRGASITPDAHRYLLSLPLQEAIAPPLTLVANWSAALARR